MTRPEALILLTDDVDETQARAIARAVRATFTRAEGEEWERLANRRRQARHYAKINSKSEGSPNATTDTLALAPNGSHHNLALGTDELAPQVPPVPPPPPASSPTSAPTYVRPTAGQVVALMNANTNCRIPVADRAEVAQAYLDARNRTEPPWTLPATHDRPARLIGSDWAADSRIFCRNWQDVLQEKRAREASRNAGYANGKNGHNLHAAKPRAEPTPAEIAAWIATRPDYARFTVEWATWNQLPPFARDEFSQHQRTTRKS